MGLTIASLGPLRGHGDEEEPTSATLLRCCCFCDAYGTEVFTMMGCAAQDTSRISAMKAHTDMADKLTGGTDTAATLTPGHTAQTDVEDGDYALASKFYNTEIEATKCVGCLACQGLRQPMCASQPA